MGCNPDMCSVMLVCQMQLYLLHTTFLQYLDSSVQSFVADLLALPSMWMHIGFLGNFSVCNSLRVCQIIACVGGLGGSSGVGNACGCLLNP
jgi:hypothetical protein